MTDALHYEIWRSDPISDITTLITTTTNLSYTETNDVQEVRYAYTLKAIGSYANSLMSDKHYDPLTARLHHLPVENEQEIRWFSHTDEVYSILRTDLLQKTFVPIAEQITATPPENIYTDKTDAVHAYYRIAIEQK